TRESLYNLGLDTRFIPQLDLGSKEGLTEFNTGSLMKSFDIEKKYPKWTAPEMLEGLEQSSQRKMRSLSAAFWKNVQIGHIPFPNLPGQWIALETGPVGMDGAGGEFFRKIGL